MEGRARSRRERRNHFHRPFLRRNPLQPLIFVFLVSFSPSVLFFPILIPDVRNVVSSSICLRSSSKQLFIRGSYFVSTSLGSPEEGARFLTIGGWNVDPRRPCAACYADQTRSDSNFPPFFPNPFSVWNKSPLIYIPR